MKADFSANSSILEIKNLTISFSDEDNNHKIKEVVKNLSFILRKGEILGIVGESGSGKSITSLAIMGLIPPSGTIDQKSEINGYFTDLELEELGIQNTSNFVNLLTLTETQKTRYRGEKSP